MLFILARSIFFHTFGKINKLLCNFLFIQQRGQSFSLCFIILALPLYGLLFDLSTPLLIVSLKRVITDLINNFEPRVNLIDVIADVSPDNNSVYITIIFSILNTQRPIQLDLVLDRTR